MTVIITLFSSLYTFKVQSHPFHALLVVIQFLVAAGQQYKPLVEFDRLDPLPIRSSYLFAGVEYIAEDTLNPGYLLIAEEHAISSLAPDGTVTMLLGNSSDPGYVEGAGLDARFNFIGGFTQHSPTMNIVVPDVANHCVREVSRSTWTTTKLVGNCTQSIFIVPPADAPVRRAPGVPAKEVLLNFPNQLVYDPNRNILYINVFGHNAVYRYSYDTQMVRTLAVSSDVLSGPTTFLISSDYSLLYVGHNYGITRIDTSTEKSELITGEQFTDRTVEEDAVEHLPQPFEDLERLDQAVYDRLFSAMVWLVPDKVMAVSPQPSKALRIIDLVQGYVQSICRGDATTTSVMFGDMSECKFNFITTVRNINNTLYIGEMINGSSPVIATMNVQVPECGPPSTSLYSNYTPHQDIYTNFESVTYFCDEGYALNTSYHSISCSVLPSGWNASEPACVAIELTEAMPIQGQRSGGTSVTVFGYFSPGISVSVHGEVIYNQSGYSLSFSFLMPPSNGFDVAGIFFDSGTSWSRTVDFTYTPDPVISKIDSTGTIISGGLTRSFLGSNLEYTQEYILVFKRMNQTLSNECSKHDGYISCLLGNLEGFGDVRGRRYVSAVLIGDGAEVAGTNVNFTVYENPVFDDFSNVSVKTIMVGQDKTISLSGQNLTTGFVREDYVITIEGIGKCEITPDDRFTPELIECRPRIPDLNGQRSSIREIQVSLGNFRVVPGSIQFIPAVFVPTPGGVTSAELSYIIPLVVVFSILIIAVAVVLFLWFRRQRHQHYNPPSMFLNSVAVRREDDKWYMDLNVNLRWRLKDMAIDPADVSYDHKAPPLGKGNFGLIYEGKLKVQTAQTMKKVAIKTLKDSPDIDSEVVGEFLQEASLLIGLYHPNVLSTIGVVWEIGDRPKAILPYMARGDLRGLLKDQSYEFTIGDLLHFSMQIASGMNFLSINKIVHRDLAARNCLVSNDYLVKVADFGLSRDVYDKDYYRDSSKQKPKPVKWMALESLIDGVYNTQTDVWAFGVTMWEICTRGTTPYPGVDNADIMRFLISGQRLTQPNSTHPDWYELMRRCWLKDPDSRPTFSELHDFLSACVHAGLKQTSNDGFEYSYVRGYTKTIPDNYQNVDAFGEVEAVPFYSDYLNVLSHQISHESEKPAQPGIHGIKSLKGSGTSGTGMRSPENEYVNPISTPSPTSTSPKNMAGETTSLMNKAGSPDYLELLA